MSAEWEMVIPFILLALCLIYMGFMVLKLERQLTAEKTAHWLTKCEWRRQKRKVLSVWQMVQNTNGKLEWARSGPHVHTFLSTLALVTAPVDEEDEKDEVI